MFELGKQKISDDFGGEEGRACIHPVVLVHFSTEEFSPVRPLSPNDSRTFFELFLIDDQHAALTREDTLGLLEGKEAKVSKASQRAVLVGGID